MTFFQSIRTRLTLWYAVLLAATLVASGLTAYFVTQSTLTENLDRSLRNEVKWVNEFIEPKAKKVRLTPSAILELQELKRSSQPEETTDESDLSDEEKAEIDEMWNQIYQHTLLSPRRHYIQILDRNGDLLYRSISMRGSMLQFNDIPYGSVNVVTTPGPDGKDIRLALMQNDYVKIFVGYPLEPLHEVLDNMFANYLVIGPIALLISIIGGWFLAHQSLKPVDTLTKAAREITAKNLNQRLPRNDVDDEIGRLTDQFNDMIGRLQESFAQVQQFSADASHELRTPLTIMRGEIEVALRGARQPKPTRELLMSIHDELVRLSSIVESLMTLVKSDSGRQVFSIENVSLDTLIRQIKVDAEVLAEPKKIKVRLQHADPVTIKGDALRLRQLFLNLVDNAVKYTPDRGSITISLIRQNGNALFTIKDTGIGIPRKDVGRIFERFYRVEQSSNGNIPGSGLGLSIAKWIAEAHQGSIDVKLSLIHI